MVDLPLPLMKKDVTSSQFSTTFTSRKSRVESRTDSRQTCYPSRPRSSKPEPISRNSFELKFVAGKGGFGKVWKVREKKSMAVFAMKEMLKTKIILKKSIDSVMN